VPAVVLAACPSVCGGGVKFSSGGNSTSWARLEEARRLWALSCASRALDSFRSLLQPHAPLQHRSAEGGAQGRETGRGAGGRSVKPAIPPSSKPNKPAVRKIGRLFTSSCGSVVGEALNVGAPDLGVRAPPGGVMADLVPLFPRVLAPFHHCVEPVMP
jgi:hypothetical protein